MNLQEFVKDIFIINLEKRPDRLDSCKKQAEKFGFKFIIIQALDGSLIDNPTNLRAGEYGLNRTYFQAVKLAKDLKLDRVLIFEDDIVFDNDFNERLNELNEIPNDWQLIYCGSNRSSCGAGWLPEENITENIVKVRSVFGCHAIIIKNTIYDVVLDELNKIDVPIDVAMTRIQQKYPCYGFKKNPCKQSDGYSDIIHFNPMYNSLKVFD